MVDSVSTSLTMSSLTVMDAVTSHTSNIKFPAYPEMKGWPTTVHNPAQVGNDMWDAAHANPGWSQIMYITTPGNWYVNANIQDASGHPGSVISYPNAWILTQNWPGTTEPAMNSFNTFTGGYTISQDPGATATYDWGWDIFFNNYGTVSGSSAFNEIMIHPIQRNMGPMTVLHTATFGGSNGIPSQTWDLGQGSSSELIWVPTSGTGTTLTTCQVPSGSVPLVYSYDLLAMINYVSAAGYLYGAAGAGSTPTLTGVAWGTEICNTVGTQTWGISDLWINWT